MKMKYRSFLLFIIVLATLASCTKLSEPYYEITGVSVDTNKRAVLLEDYTGHLCVNCASAGKMANSLQELYHGQVFVMAVHAGPFAKPSSAHPPYLEANYSCPEAEECYNYSGFNILGNPSGMVNRIPWNGKISFLPSQWTGALQHAVTLPKLAVMTVHNTWNEGNKTLTTNIATKFLSEYSGKVTLTVCLLEDNIYGGQLNNDAKTDSVPIIKNYRFMHMLRGNLNGTFGEDLATNPLKYAVFSKTYQVSTAGKPWIPANCSILAFISDAASKEVLHVAKASLNSGK